MIYRKYIKRISDVFFSVFLIVITSPIVIIVMTMLRYIYRIKPFFTQSRPGFKGKVFKIIKFKTMLDIRDEKGELLPDELRLHKLGRIIRSLSIDELPQLINVLKGDMSFIGPRPLLTKYLPLYNETQNRRHDVKPGITGWAQVNGRNAISWTEKFELDVCYVDNLSVAMDFKILILTIVKILKRENVASPTHATMEPFTGEN